MKNMKQYLVVQEAKDSAYLSFFVVVYAESEAGALRTYADRLLGVSPGVSGWFKPKVEELKMGHTYAL